MPNGLFANASLPYSMRGEPHCAHRALGLWFSRVHEIYNRRPARATVPFGAAHALGPTGRVGRQFDEADDGGFGRTIIP